MITPDETLESPDFPVPPLLQAAWLRQLRSYYDYYNYLYVCPGLRKPVIRLTLSRQRLGEWCGRTRSIAISGYHILEHPWGRVLETLRHEMAHQYVEEVLGYHGVPPHGEAFREACRILRVDPEPTARRGALGALERSADGRDRILARVKNLLALAQSPNEHEAANAMRMARKHLLRYNVDAAELDGRRRYEVRQIGRSKPRIQEYEYVLAHILQEHFFVEVIWLYSYDPLRNRTGRVLEIAGTPENLEMAEYVHAYVMHVAERLWRERKRSGTERGTKFQYLAGLLEGFQEKLDAQSREIKEQRGLVWRGDPALREYYRYRNPRVSHSSTSSGVFRGGAYDAGLADGKRLNLRRGVGEGTAKRGRLLRGRG